MGLGGIAIEWLEGAGVDLSRVNTRGHSLLALAVMAGSLPLCTKLIEKGADVNQRLETNRRYGSALLSAVCLKRVDMVQYFLGVGADINLMVQIKNSDNSSPLSAAVTAMDFDMLKLLLENGEADFNMGYPEIGNDGILYKAYLQSSRILSFDEHRYDMVKLMLKACADVNTTFASDSSGKGLLPHVITEGNVEMVKYLIEAKADVNKRHGEDEVYPIEEAATGIYGDYDIEILRILCDTKADVNAVSSKAQYGSAPALAFVPSYYQDKEEFKQLEAVQILLAAGADPNKQLTGGIGSALAVAAKECKGTDVLEALIAGGADVNMQLENGSYHSALMAAHDADDDDYKNFTVLLLSGAKPESGLKPEAYRAAMVASILENDAEKVKAMIKLGAPTDISLGDADFDYALAYSTILESGILQALIEAGADVDKCSSGARYGSALIAASCFGQYQAAECLINAGASVDGKYPGSYTTVIEAAEAPFSEADKACIVKFCKSNEEYGAKLLEKWGKQKSDVLELLKKNQPPPAEVTGSDGEQVSATFTPIFATYTVDEVITTIDSYGICSTSSNVPVHCITAGPKRLKSGNYVI